MKKRIELRSKVKCAITGFSGTATDRVTYMNGTCFYTVVPRMTKDQTKKSEGSFIEDCNIVLVGKMAKKQSVHPQKFTLGDTLQDTVTNFTGVATTICEYMNGCVSYCIKPKVSKKKENEMPEGNYIDQHELVLVKSVPKDKQPTIQKTGGMIPDFPR